MVFWKSGLSRKTILLRIKLNLAHFKTVPRELKIFNTLNTPYSDISLLNLILIKLSRPASSVE